jgi:nucleolin
VPVYAGNLPFAASEDELRALALGACGGDATQIVRVSVPRDRETGQGRGFGFVEMASADAADALVRASAGAQLGGRPVRFELRR